jgi:general secretion pathway protein D
MIRSRLLLYVILAGTIVVPVFAKSAESAYRAGERAEKKNDLDSAFQAYKQAHDAKPNDPKYGAAYLRIRFYASAQHIQAGQSLRDQDKLDEALAQFRLAVQIDPSNFEALGLMRRTADEIQKRIREKDLASESKRRSSPIDDQAKNAAGPVTLDMKSDVPVSIHMTATTEVIYKSIAKLAGFNVLFDPDYKPQKVTFDLKDVSLRDALSMIAMQSKTFWRPLSSNTILVSSDSGARRKDLEQNVMKTFYLRNAATPADLQQAAGTLKGILDISHIQVTPEQRSLTLRGTPDQMILAQKLLGDIDKPKSEVLIDVLVMEVSRGRLSTIGTVPPTSVSVALAPGGAAAATGGSGSGSSLTLNSFSGLTAGDISVSVPGASFTALASDTNSKVLQRPEIRAMDSEKASLKIGDRIPIATGSYQSGITSGVNTQFQYIDVGVNIDITPYVHAGNEVTLKMSLEVSSVTGEQTVDGVTEPTIGQRRIEHEARLADGEVNLIGGILEDSESKSLSGYPMLMRIPILKYLFGQDSRQRQQTEIVFAIIPHILRSTDVTDENLKMVDLGSANSVTYRKAEVKSPPVQPSPAAPLQQPAEKPAPAPVAPAAKSAVKPSTKPMPQAYLPSVKPQGSSPPLSFTAPLLKPRAASASLSNAGHGPGSPPMQPLAAWRT